MRRPLLLLGLLLVSACASRPGPQPAAATATMLPRNIAIAMRTYSWGHPISIWHIEANGEGRHSASTQIPGGTYADYDVVTRRFSAGRDAFRRIEALLAPAERGYECEQRITDGLYGDVQWEREGAQPHRRNFNYGCLSADAERAYSGMWEAGQLVEAWAEAGEVVETRQVREPRP